MSAHTPEGVEKQKKIYRAVGAALVVGTIITVLAAEVHLGIIVGIVLALIVATVKGSLVAGYFMHLFSEKKLIYAVLGITAPLVVVMLGLILFSFGDQQGRHHGIFVVPQRHVQPHAAEKHEVLPHPEHKETPQPEAVRPTPQPESPQVESTQPEPEPAAPSEPEKSNVP